MRTLQFILLMMIGTALIAQEEEKTIDVDVDEVTKKMVIIKKENGQEKILKYDLDDEEAIKILKELEDEGVLNMEEGIETHGSDMDKDNTSRTHKRIIKRQRTIKRPAAKSDAYLGVIANPGEKGTTIEEVIVDSPAHQSGIESGDIIVSINGARLKEYRSINRLISFFEADDTLEVVVLRNDKEKNIKLTLAKRKGEIH